MLLDLDTGAGVTETIGAGRDLQPFAIEGDGVVIADGALVFEAEHLLGLQAVRPGTVGGSRLGRWHAKPGAKLGQVALEQPVGVIEGADIGPAQFFHQAVLQGP